MFIGNKIRSYFGYAQSAGNSFISNIPLIIYYVLTKKKKNKVNLIISNNEKTGHCFLPLDFLITRTSETLCEKKIKMKKRRKYMLSLKFNVLLLFLWEAWETEKKAWINYKKINFRGINVESKEKKVATFFQKTWKNLICVIFIQCWTYFLQIMNETSSVTFCLCNCLCFFHLTNTHLLSTLKTCSRVKLHVPKHRKPLTDKEFGYYLAGLIDGDGCFTAKSLIICFAEKDTSLAYYLKRYIAYGNVYKIKDKKAVVYTIAHSKALIKVLSLVNGKLRHESKINNANNKLIPYLNSLKLNPCLDNISLDKTNDLNNHWFAGFSDADACFQIKILERNKLVVEKRSVKKSRVEESIKFKITTEIRLNFQIDQKAPELLNLIKENFGGNVGYRKNQNTYYYGSTCFKTAKNFIKYFDSYHLLSCKHISYIKWRKAFLIIQEKEHFTINGINKIRKLKSTLNK